MFESAGNDLQSASEFFSLQKFHDKIVDMTYARTHRMREHRCQDCI